MKPVTAAIVRKALPKRRTETQKWDYGHCLVVAGSRRLLGAAVLTTKAALRGGAGLVTLATPRSLQALVYSQILEALTLPLEETVDGTVDWGAVGTIKTYAKERGVTSIVVGPGLTRQEQTTQFIRTLVKEVEIPMVLDADALNVKPPLDGQAFRCLTPHRKEFSRLMSIPEDEVIKKGPALGRAFAKNHPNAALVLKGFKSKVFFRSQAWQNPTGNPGMAKGGSGDVLAGLMGAFVAQLAARKVPIGDYLQGVLAAVYLHGLSGDLACRALSEVSMNAEDIVAHLPEAMKKTLNR
ncbi:MAG: NAD(P)H-hydrate dehydratase [Elusimicrobia bacterium]|nr:NAD(P)H-hydrate dehydratase [Elusimicrobiota bacterium]